ncbi:MAG TPA: CinA family protein [Caulobacteraceae bacterium]|nr:CinA family protein [Caulobacteraceae bacterium]
MFPFEITALATLVLDEARTRNLRITTAESCTGGLVAAALTAIAGSSDVFERGFVTYSNRAKEELLGVPGELIADLGAVSEPVVRMMAEGALEAASAHVSVAITGVAGPGGGTAMKPVGTVHFATARSNGPILHRHELFADMDRDQVRLASLQVALEMLRERLK